MSSPWNEVVRAAWRDWRTELMLAAVLGLAFVATELHRNAGPVPPREGVVSALAEAAATGRSVPAMVAARGHRPLDWGRAVDRELRDPGFEAELRRRVDWHMRAASLQETHERDSQQPPLGGGQNVVPDHHVPGGPAR